MKVICIFANECGEKGYCGHSDEHEEKPNCTLTCPDYPDAECKEVSQ